MQVRIERLGVGQAGFGEKTVGNGDHHDARRFHVRAAQDLHAGRISPDRVFIPLLFGLSDFLEIKIDDGVVNRGIL
ncbi:MAG: hypothetical protein BWX99_02819 [Deltaproteobacteria bacterium ADurb.Bin151]|nr:MAG: hypothetical protein BWX99_02819 [Deltaproteobacteria bacterium ADurb.Bin151]